MTEKGQTQQSEWHEQWSMFRDSERFLFEEWIKPAAIEDFRDKDVLEAGCGGGQHTSFVAPVARNVTAVDLNTADIARHFNRDHGNVSFVEADIATMDLGRCFDIVFCIGVIHHTDNPGETFENLYRHVKPGGKMIVWTYSSEGNALVEYGVEPIRRLFIRHLPRKVVSGISTLLTALMYPVVYTIYQVEAFRFLPFFDYFKNFRKMSFGRNALNVFDKLNAPQTIFTTREVAESWFSRERFDEETISIVPYAGVSYSLVGTKRLSER